MRKFGVFLLVVGAIWVMFAMGMDTSIAIGDGRRVNNFGLIAAKQNQIMVGGLILLSGLLMMIFGGRKSGASTIGKDVDMRPCPFCAEPIKKEAIKCKHCGSDLTLVPSRALKDYPEVVQGWVARVLCDSQEDRINTAKSIEDVGLPVSRVGDNDFAAGPFDSMGKADEAIKLLMDKKGLKSSLELVGD